MKKLLLTGFLFCSLFGMANQEFPTPTTLLTEDLEMPDEWTEYKTIDGIKIEYKMKRCESDKMRAQNLLLFKFTNTTDQELTLSWLTQEYRNGECWNCQRLTDEEFNYILTLAPGEVAEGKETVDQEKELYIFGNFINLVPGMTEQTLTNFEFVEVTVR
ncbi:MAG: hypothetical protein AB8B56_11625 [Crocinitomicaceae bacterium]